MTSLATTAPLTPAPSAPAPPTAGTRPRAEAAAAIAALVAFTAYSAWVIYREGYLGFLTLAGREPWAMQMLIDLVIALGFGLSWLVRDARRRGIAAWPYIPLTIATGSIGLLAYAVRRCFAATPPRGT